jgi:hypothetical protein
MLWDKYQEGIEKDLLKECREFVSKFKSGNIVCDIIKEREIIGSCNLISNPAYVYLEDMEFEKMLWLSQKMIGALFQVELHTINYHIKGIYKSGELE